MPNIISSAIKFITSPIASKKYIGNAIKYTGGRTTHDALLHEGRLAASRAAAKAALKERLNSKQITRDMYGSMLRNSNVAHGGPKGNFTQRVIANAADDISHPISNSKKSLMGHFLEYNAEKDKIMGKSPGGLAIAGALGVGLPAWMISSTLKDKELTNTSKAGRAVSYAVLPFPLRRFIPSVVGYSVADKVFSKKNPQQTMVDPKMMFNRYPGE